MLVDGVEPVAVVVAVVVVIEVVVDELELLDVVVSGSGGFTKTFAILPYTPSTYN